MAQQIINLGTNADDKTGSRLRIGGAMINANFTELYNAPVVISQHTTTEPLLGSRIYTAIGNKLPHEVMDKLFILRTETDPGPPDPMVRKVYIIASNAYNFFAFEGAEIEMDI